MLNAERLFHVCAVILWDMTPYSIYITQCQARNLHSCGNWKSHTVFLIVYSPKLFMDVI